MCEKRSRTYLAFVIVLVFGVVGLATGQNFFHIHSVSEEPVDTRIKIVWCTTSPEEQKKCGSFSMANERDRIRVGYDYFKIECIQASNKDECMQYLDEEKVTLTSLDAGELFIGGRYHSLVPIAQEMLEGGFRFYYSVAVVKKGDLSNVRSLRELRGKKGCFAGVGTMAGWIVPVYRLMKDGGMEVIDCNNHVKSAIDFFGPSCAVNSLKDKYNPIGDNSNKLCQICIGKIPGGRCTDSDPYADYDGAFRCLLEAGEIAFLKHTTVPELIAGVEFGGTITKDAFELFCPDGSRRPIDDYRACNWGTVPSDAIVASSATSPEIRLKYVRFLTKAAALYGGNLRLNSTFAEQNKNTNIYGTNNDFNRDYSNRNEFDQFGNRIENRRFKRQSFGGGNFALNNTDRNTDFNNRNTDFNDRNTDYNNQNTDFNRNTDLNERNTDFNNRNADFNNRNTDFNNRNTDFNNRNTDSNNRNTDFNNRNTDSNNRNTDFNNRNTDFNNRNTDSNNRNTDYNNRNTDYDNRNTDLNSRNPQFDANRNNLNNRNNDPNDPYAKDLFSRDPYKLNSQQFGVNIDPYETDPSKNINRNPFLDLNNNTDFAGQGFDGRYNGSYYEVFNLFESSPKYGLKGNLLFQDSTRNFANLSESEQTYSGYLGQAMDVIMGIRDCPVKKMTLCVTSDPEMEKCVKMRTALKAQLLMPDMVCYKAHSHINCMQAIQAGVADVTVLDASDVYTAGLNFDLVPFISEVYNLGEPEYYVVAVAKESDPSTELTYLRGKYTCHGGINMAAGWVYPLAFLISNGWIRPYGCNAIRAAAEYFTKSCAPGALSTEYNSGVPYDNLCDLCHGASFRYCRRDASEDYFGHTGAFRCLVEGGGHVAFVKHTTVDENSGGKRREWWARDALIDDFELLCPDGTRAEVLDYQRCNLGKVKANAIVTRGGYGYNETQINAYINLFMYSQTFYGKKTFDEFSFSMFSSTPPYWDLIFQDATQQLRIIPPSKRYYSDYLGKDYMRARRIVDCHASASLSQISLVTIFTLTSLLFCL